MITNIQKWGNSQGVFIPKFLLETMQWKDDEQIVITAEKDKIIIEKASPRKNIKELFNEYDGDYKPAEIDWGKPEGKEIW